MRPTTLFALTSLSAVFLVACSGGTNTSSDGLTTVSWAQSSPESMAYIPYLVADELGYFADEGLRVELLPGSEDVATSTLVAIGNADFGVGGAGEVMNAVNAGGDLRVVFEEYTKAAEGIVVPEGSAIESVDQLAGRTIGLASDEERALLASALEPIGLTLDDVELAVVGTSGPTLANELQKGTIDAFAGSGLDFAAMSAAGFPTREITPDELLTAPTGSIFVTGRYADDNPQLVEGFLRAFAKATRAALSDPASASAIARDRVPEEWQNEENAQALFDLVIEIHQPYEATIGEVRPEFWEATRERLVDVGEVEGPVDLDAILDPSFVGRANEGWDRDDVQADITDFVSRS